MDRQKLQHSFRLNFLQESITESSSLLIFLVLRNEFVSLSLAFCLMQLMLDTFWLFTLCFLSLKLLFLLFIIVFWMSLTNSSLENLRGIRIWFSLSPFFINSGFICTNDLFSESLESRIVFRRCMVSEQSAKFRFTTISPVGICLTKVRVAPSCASPSFLLEPGHFSISSSSSFSTNLPAKI